MPKASLCSSGAFGVSGGCKFQSVEKKLYKSARNRAIMSVTRPTERTETEKMPQFKGLIDHIRRAALRDESIRNSDPELLRAFIERKDELAFETLVRRFGPMVFGVCRRVTRNHQDAEDAFQATFVVLAHKASSIRPMEMVGSWLYGVAYRTSLKARSIAVKRAQREVTVSTFPEPETPCEREQSELFSAIDQELQTLGDRYRLPILLCDLEGKTIQEAMQQLGWPQGTVAGRLFRGRKLLGKRLASRGLAYSSASLALIGSRECVTAGVPIALLTSTVKFSLLMSTGETLFGEGVSPNVLNLFQGAINMMMISKLKTATVTICVVAILIASGGGLLELQRAEGQQDKPAIQAQNPTINNVEKPEIETGEEDETKKVEEKDIEMLRLQNLSKCFAKWTESDQTLHIKNLTTSYVARTIKYEGKERNVMWTEKYILSSKFKIGNFAAYVAQKDKIIKIESKHYSKYLADQKLCLLVEGPNESPDNQEFSFVKEGTILLFLLPTKEPQLVAPPQLKSR